jgi:hypothetical protein
MAWTQTRPVGVCGVKTQHKCGCRFKKCGERDLSVAAAAASSAVWVCFFEFEPLVFGKKGGRSVLRDEGLRKISVAVGTQFVYLEEW